MTRADVRRVVNVVHDIDRGDIDMARAALCALARVEVVTALDLPSLARPHTHEPKISAPRPKRPKRIADPAAVAAYRASHRYCEVQGDDCLYDGRDADGRPCVQVHHLIKRSKGGACLDEPANLLALCQAHHTGRVGWHPLGPKVWFKRLHDRLTPESAVKILKATGWLSGEEARCLDVDGRR